MKTSGAQAPSILSFGARYLGSAGKCQLPCTWRTQEPWASREAELEGNFSPGRWRGGNLTPVGSLSGDSQTIFRMI